MGDAEAGIAGVARDLIRRAEDRHNDILERMRALTAPSGARLAREGTSIKGAARTREKIAQVVSQGATVEQAAASVDDALRFTIVAPEKEYRRVALHTIAELGLAATDRRVKNFWQPEATYVGINVSARDADLVFEVQIHTPGSDPHTRQPSRRGSHPWRL